MTSTAASPYTHSPGIAFPPPRLHPFFRLLLAVIGCIVAQIIVVLLVGAVAMISVAVQGGDATAQVNNLLRDNLLLITVLTYPPTLLFLWLCRRFLDRRAFVSLGLRARGFFGQFFAGALGGFLAVAFVFGVLVLAGIATVTGWSPEAQSGGWEKALLYLLGWAGVMLCVGFFEEVCFRGYALHNLRSWLGTRPAIFIQAIAFALIHLGNLAGQEKAAPDALQSAALAMPNITLIGIFFALCYFKTSSLWFPISFHAAWNFSLGCLFSLPVSGLPIFKLLEVDTSGPAFLSGGSFGPEASILLTPVLIAMCVVIARAPDSRQSLYDMDSLQASVAPSDEVLAPTTIDTEIAVTEITEEPHENRFKSTMRPRTLELDAETAATLRALNTERRERETPPVPVSFRTPSTPVESAPPIPDHSIENRVPTETTPTEKPAPAPGPEAVESTPPAANEPSTPPTPPKKPAPRW